MIQHPKAPALPAEVVRVSVRAAAAEANSSFFEHPGVIERLSSEVGIPESEPADQDPSSDLPRERRWPLKRPGALSASRKPDGNAIPSGPSPDPHPKAGLGMNAPFSRARVARLDGWTTPLPAATHSRGPVGYQSVSG